MQSLISRSKNLILAVLCCSSLLVWNDSGSADFPSWGGSPLYSSTRHNDSIWAIFSRELKLDHKVESWQVQAEIRKLLSDRDRFYSILKAASPYLYFIHNQTQARGLPAEIALIPVIESEFNPNDRSTKGATGLWQLMPGTAHELGIKVRSTYDGRRNVVESTKAALAYFNDLGNNFNGDWYLAIAAYNCGQGAVQSAERRTRSRNFWDLRLPQETKYYVPRLLAVAAIIKNPEKYHVQLPPINNEPYFTEVKVKKSADLVKVAKSSGVSVKAMHTLNPNYKHAVANKGTTLLVPVKKDITNI